MSLKSTAFKFVILMMGFFFGTLQKGFAQSLLEKNITFSATRQPLSKVLNDIGTQGNFYFSYGSNVIRGDSLVSISVVSLSVRKTLERLLGNQIQYKESSGYIILLPNTSPEKHLIISGKVFDAENQTPIDFVSVYSRSLLVSSLSDEAGNFRLRIKDPVLPQKIAISKIGYQDTTLLVSHASSQDLEIYLLPKTIDLEGVTITNSNSYLDFLTNLLVSSRLRLTSQNLGKFFVSLPYQASLTPGLGTHGKMASQIVNKVSLNLIGGYTAGTNGVELAGVFNISKQNVRYVQAAGLFNLVAGKITGIQLAGLHNAVQDSVNGIQAAGFSNFAASHTKGIQMAGVLNKSDSTFDGIQAAGAVNLIRQSGSGIQLSGVANYNKFNFSGIQAAGLFNYTGKDFHGFQLAPFNYVKTLKGFQIGIINRAEYSEGYSLGLLNFIKNGHPHLSLVSNDLALFNLSLKTGTRKLYTLLTAGIHPFEGYERFVWGIGVGHEWIWGEKISVQIEASQLNIALNNRSDSQDPVLRLHTLLNYNLNSRFTVFIGPSLSLQLNQSSSSKTPSFPDPLHQKLTLSDKHSLWVGWQSGVSWYMGRKFFHK